ncbi:ATP-dependent RNA helicase RhlE [Kordiimonas lacus]|uniref:ATP-dependent RNA helicase RhlE n=1 Tax=Kordiimonas lacus TaxID=637679 RepID=A0A1G7B026_9PROT|nr:ATP-dependent RNA helicase RhlE [Kordiimonas lacus]
MVCESLHLKEFNTLGLAEPILRALTAEGYTTPTPIQAGVIPAMLDGKDIVGIAQTGTGKTAAFVLPLLQRVHEIRKMPYPKSCKALILAPTRELAAQIEDAIRTYGKYLKSSSAVIVGGAKAGPQIRAMSRGVDILVATPGRLEDLMSTGAVMLDQTNTVILDEADQMLDLGFMPAIRRIMQALPKKRQTALLSATMPKQIRGLAEDFLYKPVEVSVAPQSKPIERITQSVIHVEKANKRQILVDVMRREDIDRAVVFSRTKHGANKLAQVLVQNGIQADAIHGNKSQSQRVRTLDAFKAGKVPILVATDIAARGIDVDGVSHVFNFDLPNVPEVFVHRIGRTARAGATGIAISICDESEREFLRDIQKLIGFKIELDELSATDLVPEQAPEKPGGKRSAGRGRSKPAGTSGRGRARNGRAKPEGAKAGDQRTQEPRKAPARADASPTGENRKRRRPQKSKGRNGQGAQNALNGENGQSGKRNQNSQGSKGGRGNQGGENAGLSRMLGNIERSQRASGRRQSA